MSATITRTSTALLGTPASPSTVAAGASPSTAALDLTQTNGGAGGVVEAFIGGQVITGASPPTTAIQVNGFWSIDGTNYVSDQVSNIAVPLASTSYPFRYDPPRAATKAYVTVFNGATNSVTAWFQGQVVIAS